MHAGIKLVIGMILILFGLWLLLPVDLIGMTAIKPWGSLNWWEDFLTVVKGVIPPIIIILGVLIVWIEGEELKAPVVPEVEQKKPVKRESKKK